MCLLVCLLVCLSSFYRPHDICPLCGAASEWPREQEPSSRAALRARRASACTARARARMPYNFSTKESLRWCLSKTKPCARACCRIRNCRDFQKKGKKKTNMPLPKFSSQFAFSWSVYFWNRTESYSSQIEFAGPHGITENQATYLHRGGEARAKKRARPSTSSLGPWFNLICNFTFSYLILSKTIGRKRLRTWSLVGADLGQLVFYKRLKGRAKYTQ